MFNVIKITFKKFLLCLPSENTVQKLPESRSRSALDQGQDLHSSKMLDLYLDPHTIIADPKNCPLVPWIQI
jgi:hypothetical protein